MIIHTAVVTHAHGVNFYTGVTEADVIKQVADWCRHWWKHEGLLEDDLTDNDKDTIAMYFEHSAGEESYDLDESDLVGYTDPEPAQEIKPSLYIVVNGGVVQGIVSDDPTTAANGLERITVIDYGTEGCEEDELGLVEQADGEILSAVVLEFGVTKATLGKVLSAEEAAESRRNPSE
jgi:hypothetical protein